MFCIQSRDLEEGFGALWSEYKNSRYETKESARMALREIRKSLDDECLLQFRITEVGSDAYYSQPTDKLEY